MVDKIYGDAILEQIEQQSIVINGEIKKNEEFLLIQNSDDIEKVDLLKANELLQKKCSDLQSANSKLMKDNRALKKLLEASKSMNLYKDVKIKQLKFTENTNVAESVPEKRMLFKEFDSHFTAAEIKEIRSFGQGKRKDAAFVTKCVDCLYKGDKSQILHKCSGERKIKGKTPISPEKRELLSKMLVERVEADKTSEEEDFERCDRLNRLMGDAIYNLTKRHQASKQNLHLHST